jgi:hypothetical protein
VVEAPKTSRDLIAAVVSTALDKRDLTMLEPILADDVRYASCVGKSQVIEWMQGALARGVDVAVSEVVADADRVVLGLDVRQPGTDEARSFYQVLFVSDGKVVEVGAYDERTDALAAAPSPPPSDASGPPTGVNGMAAVLPVRDLAAALEHYRRLGFAVSTYEGGGYGYARRGAADFHLALVPDLAPRTTTSAVYLHVDDAEALYSEWRSAGVEGQFFEPSDTDYGLREGAHVDRDGNLLRFGSPISPRAS